MTRRSEIIRILSNYLRLFATFVMGLLIVRLVVGFGEEAFGLFNLITVGMGIGIMLQRLLRIAVVPRLTETYAGRETHSREFRSFYASSWILALGAALLGTALFSLMLFFLDSFTIPEGYRRAAIFFIAYRLLYTVLTVALTPLTSLLYVIGWQGRANLLLTLQRFAELTGVLAAFFFAPDNGPAQLEVLALVTLLALVVTFGGWGIYILRLDPLFRPHLRSTDAEGMRLAVSRVGWSAGVVFAINLYVRFGVLFVNIAYGIAASLVFGIAVNVIGYVWQLTTGIVQGLDAVFSALSADPDGEHKRRHIIWLSSSLQGTIILFSAGFLFLALEDLIWLWLGSSLDDPVSTIPLIATVSFVMLVGTAMRGFSEGWVQAISGAGRIDAYAKALLPMALVNPVLVWLAWMIWPQLGVLSVAILYAVLQFVTHGIRVPLTASQVLDIPLRALIAPFLRPLAMAVAAVAVASLAEAVLEPGARSMRVLLAMGIFAVFGMLTLLWLLLVWRRMNRAARLSGPSRP